LAHGLHVTGIALIERQLETTTMKNSASRSPYSLCPSARYLMQASLRLMFTPKNKKVAILF
jgi:hypothetical protein